MVHRSILESKLSSCNRGIATRFVNFQSCPCISPLPDCVSTDSSFHLLLFRNIRIFRAYIRIRDIPCSKTAPLFLSPASGDASTPPCTFFAYSRNALITFVLITRPRHSIHQCFQLRGGSAVRKKDVPGSAISPNRRHVRAQLYS